MNMLHYLRRSAWLILAVMVASTAPAQPPAAPAPSPAAPASNVAPAAATVPGDAARRAAAAPAAMSVPTGYQLSANDAIAVEVFGEEDLRTTARLSADGTVSLPLLGSVSLAGLTLPQATARLTELYGRDYLVHPRLNVTLIAYAKRRFTVLGQVNRPGSYEIPEGGAGGLDILEAIALAGGYTRIAAPERITVRRKGEVIRVNAKKVARGNAGTFIVQPGDSITVGESIF